MNLISRQYPFLIVNGLLENVFIDELKGFEILADAGGGNGCRSCSFKLQVQEQLSDRYRLSMTVSQYPTRCSKWKLIEHHIFSQISLNCAGKPLRSLNTMLKYIRGATTQVGLTVRAVCLDGTFEKGQKVFDDQM